ncbi:MAG: J domain-containing protein [Paludibacteraceae bacterium]|nr:J domain-containing protein [Paludibacteraceae bacterium]
MEYIAVAVLLLFFVLMSVLDLFGGSSSDDSQFEKKSDARSKSYATEESSEFFRNACGRKDAKYSDNVRLLGTLLAYNPHFYKLTEEDFKKAGFSFYEASDIMSVAKTWKSYLDTNLLVASIMERNLSFSDRRNLVHKLFKLANIGDGIKDDEWYFIMDVMNGLKMNSANTGYLLRLYSGWRTGAPSGGENDIPQRFFLGDCLVRVVNEVLYLSPKSSNKEHLASSYISVNFKNCIPFLGKLGARQDEPTLKQAIDVINQNVTRQVRFTFVKMLYKLAAVDEGIKYDEWLLLEFLLEQFKLNKSVATLYRRFAGLRSEGYNYKTYQSFSEKYRGASYAGNSSSSQGRTSSSRQGAPAPVSASLASAFAVLGLAPTASESEAQEAYHRLALLHHPDLPRNAERRAESVRIMAKINVAYAAITQNTK